MKELIAKLADPDRKTQEDALRRLGQARAESAVPFIAPYLTHDLAVMRAAALRALLAIDTDSARAAIAANLRGQEPWFKLEAVPHLRAADRLAPLLRDRDPAVREAAYAETRRLDPRVAARAALDQRDAYLRRQALDWIGHLDDPVTRSLFERALDDPKLRPRAVEWFVRLPDAHVAPLVEADDAAARDRLERVESVAGIVALLERGKRRDLLQRLLVRRSVDQLRAIARATGARTLLFALVENPAWALAEDEPIALAAVPRLDPEPIVHDPRPRVAWAAAEILLRAGRPAPVPLLMRVARSSNVEGRRLAVDGLIGQGADVSELWDIEDKVALRKIAFASHHLLSLIRVAEECRGEAARRARKMVPKLELDRLLELLRHERGSVRRFGAAALEDVTDERAVPPLLAAVDDESYEVQHAAIRALAKFGSRDDVADRFIACLTYGELSVREAAILALGENKVQRAVPELVRLLGHPLLKRKVMYALRQMGDRRAYLAVLRRQRRDEMIAREREKIQKRHGKAR